MTSVHKCRHILFLQDKIKSFKRPQNFYYFIILNLMRKKCFMYCWSTTVFISSMSQLTVRYLDTQCHPSSLLKKIVITWNSYPQFTWGKCMTVSAIMMGEKITASNQRVWELWPKRGQSNKVLKMEKLKKVAICISFASLLLLTFFWQTSK